MTELALSLGSNIDADSNIRRAVDELRQLYGELLCSRVYRSKAVGFQGGDFLNLVVCIDVDDSLERILTTLKQLEEKLGRVRGQEKFSSRLIDIDVLFYGEYNGEECGIQLPRDEIEKYAFVLKPLAELLPERVHFTTKRMYSSMWDSFDESDQQLEAIDFDWG